MYIPSGITFLHLLQLPLSFFGVDQSTSQPAQVNGGDFDEKHNNLGNISPYHDAPTIPGVSVGLPEDCTVDQVILLHRHGSRGPTTGFEDVLIKKLASTLKAASKKIQEADLPPELEFLKEGYEYQLVAEDLTAIGRQELFNHGVEFSFRYPTFSTNYTVSTTYQRVIDSAHFFCQGLFGREADKVKFFTIEDCPECHDPVPWLTPWSACPNIPYAQSGIVSQQWIDKYVPPIRDRLNALVPGVGFDIQDIQGAMYACPYDLANRGKSPWCNVFTSFELRSLDYQLDLYADVITGRYPSEDPGQFVGAFYVKKLVDRLANVTGKAESLYLDFAHDYTILFALSAMGLNKDAHPLTPDHPLWNRKFKSSNETPFAARMVWERFTCKKSFTGTQVRLLLNGATYPMTDCQKSGKDHKYGTCSLAAFQQANKWSLDVQYHSGLWNASCGISSVGNSLPIVHL